MRVLADHGIHTGVSMMPILSFIKDNEENIWRIVAQACDHGTAYIIRLIWDEPARPAARLLLRQGGPAVSRGDLDIGKAQLLVSQRFASGNIPGESIRAIAF
jgi:hypothetical protein